MTAPTATPGWRDTTEQSDQIAMWAAHDCAHFARLHVTGAITSQRRRRSWRRAWAILGPFMPIALAAGMLAGTVAAVIERSL